METVWYLSRDTSHPDISHLQAVDIKKHFFDIQKNNRKAIPISVKNNNLILFLQKQAN